MGYVAGHRMGASSARTAARKDALLEAAVQKRREKSKEKRDDEVEYLEYQVAKNKMLNHTAAELQRQDMVHRRRRWCEDCWLSTDSP